MKYYGHVPYKGLVEISEQPIYVPKDKEEVRHGTVYRYKECGCRCEKCVAAYKESNRRKYEQRKKKH